MISRSGCELPGTRRLTTPPLDDTRRLTRRDEASIPYVDHADFHRPEASRLFDSCHLESRIQDHGCHFDRQKSSVRPVERVPSSSAFLSAFACRPVLSPEAERLAFLTMNYRKFQAEMLRRQNFPPAETTHGQINHRLSQAEVIRHRLVEANLRLVISLAKRAAASVSQLMDLTSDGLIPLIRAVDLFDVSRGFRFSTYATWAVRHQMSRSLRSRQKLTERISHIEPRRLSQYVETRSSSDGANAESNPRHQMLTHALIALPEREQFIVAARFGLNGAQQDQSLQQIAKQVGLSRERVRQLLRNALQRLREELEGNQVHLN